MSRPIPQYVLGNTYRRTTWYEIAQRTAKSSVTAALLFVAGGLVLAEQLFPSPQIVQSDWILGASLVGLALSLMILIWNGHLKELIRWG